eukprot:10205-Heterococcus_DN1.PRE.1
MDDADLVKCGCTALYTLSAAETILVKTALDDLNVWELLPNVSTAYINSSDTLHSACMIVQNLARCVDYQVKLGTCEAVVLATTSDNSNAGVAAAACHAIQELALNSGSRVKPGNAGACKAVLGALRARGSNEAIAAAGCRAVVNLQVAQNGDKLT